MVYLWLLVDQDVLYVLLGNKAQSSVKEPSVQQWPRLSYDWESDWSGSTLLPLYSTFYNGPAPDQYLYFDVKLVFGIIVMLHKFPITIHKDTKPVYQFHCLTLELKGGF